MWFSSAITLVLALASSTASAGRLSADNGISLKSSLNSGLSLQAWLNAWRLNFSKRIIGGVPAKEDEFRFLLYLRPCASGNQCYLCGGTIISKHWILTAAHCVAPINKYEYVHVYFGKHQEWDKGDHDVKLPKDAIYVHKGYSTHPTTGVPVNDIALIYYKNASHGYKKFPQLATREPQAGTSITVAGWGVVDTKTDTTAKLLRKVTVPVHSDAQCKAWVGAPFAPATTWCAGVAKGGKDACQGDSGGPAFKKENGKFVIYGIVSYGAGCGQAKSPGVYASVNAYRSWINGVMGGTVAATTIKGTAKFAGATSGGKPISVVVKEDKKPLTSSNVKPTTKPKPTKPKKVCTFMEHLYGECSETKEDPWLNWDNFEWYI